jgi:hypothetical protein
LSGTGSPRVPATRAGTGLGYNLYTAAGMDFLVSIFYPDGHGYGQAISSGRVPVAISRQDMQSMAALTSDGFNTLCKDDVDTDLCLPIEQSTGR